MFYIRKSTDHWAIVNNRTGKRKLLSDLEIEKLLGEFPNLRLFGLQSQSLTYFRNRITSIADLP